MDEQELEDRIGVRGTREEVFTYEVGPDESYSLAVVNAISAVEGVEAHSLPEILYHRINPDALNCFADLDTIEDPGELSVSFRFCGYAVTVFPDVVVIISQVDGGCR